MPKKFSWAKPALTGCTQSRRSAYELPEYDQNCGCPWALWPRIAKALCLCRQMGGDRRQKFRLVEIKVVRELQFERAVAAIGQTQLKHRGGLAMEVAALRRGREGKAGLSGGGANGVNEG